MGEGYVEDCEVISVEGVAVCPVNISECKLDDGEGETCGSWLKVTQKSRKAQKYLCSDQ